MERTKVIYAYKYKGNVIYVGQTFDLKQRHKEHLKGKKTYFDQFCGCVGETNLELIVLEQNVSKKDAHLRERHWYLLLRPTMNQQIPFRLQEDYEKEAMRYQMYKEEKECLAAMKV